MTSWIFGVRSMRRKIQLWTDNVAKLQSVSCFLFSAPWSNRQVNVLYRATGSDVSRYCHI